MQKCLPRLVAFSIISAIGFSGVSCKTSAFGDARSAVAKPQRSFNDAFSRTEILEETGRMRESASRNWWLNSGARLYVDGDSATTVQGELPEKDEWRLKFAKNNPDETDDGYHPQNIFRLVTRSSWMNCEQKARFKILDYHLSASSHRQASNGLLFFNRYRDGNNLYYAGIRVDGTAVIKKKIKGTYFTMASQPVYAGAEYDRNENPNLLPTNQWIGLKCAIRTNPDKTVSIKVYLDKNDTEKWSLAVEGTDDGKRYGRGAILASAYAGIRTDFMDAEFDDYSIKELK